ncbi:MAG: hypothetical protein IJ141_08355 [Lachnospiraceae bacterium]|nr:hypothetical protein [Lachnospiraceae bacterium]
MIVGEKPEDINNVLKRHIEECKKAIEGWKNEFIRVERLGREKGPKDDEYLKRCRNMIKIWENTLKKLNEELKKIN